MTFVGGFAVEAVRARYPGLRVVVPPDWSSTGSASSLLSVPLDPERGALVVYSDIIVRPELVDARDALLDAGAVGALVSGSGPTVLGLAETAQEALRVAREVEGIFDRVEVAQSPAGGPDLSAE